MDENLGTLILLELKKRGIKQSYVADQMGIVRQAFNQIKKRKTFDIDFLNQLKNVTGIDYEELIKENAINERPDQTHSDNSTISVNEGKTNYSTSFKIALNFSIEVNSDNYKSLPSLIEKLKEESEKMGYRLTNQ